MPCDLLKHVGAQGERAALLVCTKRPAGNSQAVRIFVYICLLCPNGASSSRQSNRHRIRLTCFGWEGGKAEHWNVWTLKYDPLHPTFFLSSLPLKAGLALCYLLGERVVYFLRCLSSGSISCFRLAICYSFSFVLSGGLSGSPLASVPYRGEELPESKKDAPKIPVCHTRGRTGGIHKNTPKILSGA